MQCVRYLLADARNIGIGNNIRFQLDLLYMPVEVGMRGEYKQFSEELYKQNNSPAINAVLQYLSDIGLYGALNEDKYGPDIVMYSGYRKISYIEVERKRSWHTSTSDRNTDRLGFPFPTVQLPERKGKFLRKRLPMEFWILNSTLNCAIIIPDYSISSSQLVEVPNSQLSSGELFYQIPIELCIMKSLEVSDG